mmetsp:Transcript_33606/g.46535  ORF Transcript_33606/g.46535 Transcript_33606/m.46535 type:complete len:523 (-) Transcript_33606:212-1780(-)|eukprot:CAMPEP_0196573146 /NCGR_PEP_ID=MMETSP1081-20130531/3088_1 /TAXON_ID=36882 /ORGANISM="Pyramimonas amylifera, Strain CCMP720" /LENGTH=522 /DNA_ID=CAMNT_0041890759 /DNA_START=101 /DNA_END=1669 /DNA_ORIENTATION=+
METPVASERPRLNLKPRTLPVGSEDPDAKESGKNNVFGEARPREAVIAARSGVKEDELIKELAAKEWQGNIRLTKSQEEEKNVFEADISSAKEKLKSDIDPGATAALNAEIILKEKRLEDLMKSFEEMAFKQAKEGGIRRDRSREFEQNQANLQQRVNQNVPNPQGFGRGYGTPTEDAFGAQFGGVQGQGPTQGYNVSTNRRGGYSGGPGRSPPTQGAMDGRGMGRGRGHYDDKGGGGRGFGRGNAGSLGRGGQNYYQEGQNQHGYYKNTEEYRHPQQHGYESQHEGRGGGRGRVGNWQSDQGPNRGQDDWNSQERTEPIQRGGGSFYDDSYYNNNQQRGRGGGQGYNNRGQGYEQRPSGHVQSGRGRGDYVPRGDSYENNRSGRGYNRGGHDMNGGQGRGYGSNNYNAPPSPGSLSQKYDRGGSFNDLLLEEPRQYNAGGNYNTGGANYNAGGGSYNTGGRNPGNYDGGRGANNQRDDNQGYGEGRGRGRGRSKEERGAYDSRVNSDLVQFTQHGDQYGDR